MLKIVKNSGMVIKQLYIELLEKRVEDYKDVKVKFVRKLERKK